MKAISLWQPWASLIACGAKPYETRSWAPPRDLIGQPIAIHAAKKVDRGATDFATDLCYGQHASEYGEHIPQGFQLGDSLHMSWDECPDDLLAVFGETTMPVGCVVAIAKLEAAFQLGERTTNLLGNPAAKVVRAIGGRSYDGFAIPLDDFGDYSPGRWAWLLKDANPVNPPTPAVGRQGFFDLPQGWLVAA